MSRQYKQITTINEKGLQSFADAIQEEEKVLHQKLLDLIPNPVKQRHIDYAIIKKKKVEEFLSFSRTDFVSDILFSEDGFNLTPRVWTKGTEKLPMDQRKPSVSAKDHLPYFEDNEFVATYMEYSKVNKMLNTYVGSKTENTGFWKYIEGGRVRPSYRLDKTTTGRTSSDDPNGQNIPKRGELAKVYRKIFIPTPGYVLLESLFLN